jgi:hypothetical protein
VHISEETGNHHHDRVDLGKNTFHLVGLDKRAAIVLQQKVSVVSWNAALPIFRVA